MWPTWSVTCTLRLLDARFKGIYSYAAAERKEGHIFHHCLSFTRDASKSFRATKETNRIAREIPRDPSRYTACRRRRHFLRERGPRARWKMKKNWARKRRSECFILISYKPSWVLGVPKLRLLFFILTSLSLSLSLSLSPLFFILIPVLCFPFMKLGLFLVSRQVSLGFLGIFLQVQRSVPIGLLMRARWRVEKMPLGVTYTWKVKERRDEFRCKWNFHRFIFFPATNLAESTEWSFGNTFTEILSTLEHSLQRTYRFCLHFTLTALLFLSSFICEPTDVLTHVLDKGLRAYRKCGSI